MSTGWRILGLFWATVGGFAVLLVGTLALLGPPRPARVAALPPYRPPAPRVAARTPRPTAPGPAQTTTPPLDPSLSVESRDFPGRLLPAIAPDGRRASTVYAAAVPSVLRGQARLAIVLDGIGLDHADSFAALRALPAPVSLAVSPYAEDLAPLVAEARRRGHEVLVSLPMEPEDSALADEGDRAIRPDADPATNARNLEWALSAANGIVGATAVDPSGNGEHVTGSAPLFRHAIAETLAADGLLFIGGAGVLPPALAGLPVASADLSVGAGPAPDDLDRSLEQAAADAARLGTTIVTLGPPIPSTEARLEAFLRTLPGRGIVLVPVSALASERAQDATNPPDVNAPDPAAEEAVR